ncbi:hypothetical protein [Bacillus sp. PS06]|uniref:hypothetical protein n=1 Tax=Bacillus sp. PS06 TaxID=2764176 RepID=UPI001782FE5C|nr:hypothetical protein [Bacillus sp. PS06]MBD8068143.1 hypothetical protein [Bacillus sp. PS06]
MLRHELNGKEFIIRFAQRLSLEESERDEIYKKVVCLGEQLLMLEDESALIIQNEGVNIVLDVKFGELIVVTIQYLVENSNIF